MQSENSDSAADVSSSSTSNGVFIKNNCRYYRNYFNATPITLNMEKPIQIMYSISENFNAVKKSLLGLVAGCTPVIMHKRRIPDTLYNKNILIIQLLTS